MLAWNISHQEESEDSEGIVTISSEEEETKEIKDIIPKCRCKGKKGHQTKKHAIECISKEKWKKDMKAWSPHIEALNKAINRENHKEGDDYGKKLAEMMRKEAEEAEKEKEDPEAVKPKTEVCHTDITSKTFLCNSRKLRY